MNMFLMYIKLKFYVNEHHMSEFPENFCKKYLKIYDYNEPLPNILKKNYFNVSLH
jgi:hypothetical protein